MRSTLGTAFLTGLCALAAAGPLHAQGPERVDRFGGAVRPVRATAHTSAFPRAADPAASPTHADPARTALGTAVGMATGVAVAAVLFWTAPGLPGCCEPWQANLLLVPLAVMPALGAHDGSGRSGRLPITLAASSASVGAAYLALRRGSSGGQGDLVPLALLQFTATTLTELATAGALATRPAPR